MGDGNDKTLVVLVPLDKSSSADVNNMNPTCSSSASITLTKTRPSNSNCGSTSISNINPFKHQKKRPDSLKNELLQSVRNSYYYNQNEDDVNISFRNITYTVKHGVFLNSK